MNDQPSPPESQGTSRFDSLAELRDALSRFAAAREWQRFHSPKNLAIALMVEAAELGEHFQWISEAESERLAPERLAEIELELADVLFYLVRLADRLGLDLPGAASRKLAINEERYPSERVKGSARKYSDYD